MSHLRHLLAIAALLLCTFKAVAGVQTELRPHVEQLALQLSDGYATLDSGGFTATASDQSPYVAVIFTLQGPARGNGSWQFLALYSPNESLSPELTPATGYRLEAFLRIGGRGFRQFNPASLQVSGNLVSLSGMEPGANDAMCCPTTPVATSFLLRGGALVEHRVGS